MIIGLTSFIGAGKTSVCDYLLKKGFEFYSLSDVIREEIKNRGLEITRERLQEVGNELRKKYGSAVLAKMIIRKLEPGRTYVIDSIRNPAEIQALRKLKGFTLVFIDAPIRLRFERIMERKREQDPITFEDFKKTEEKELESHDSASQQLVKCREMAEFIITNDSSFEELFKKIDELLEGLR